MLYLVSSPQCLLFFFPSPTFQRVSCASLLPSFPFSLFVYATVCGVGQPADLFDSVASGSLPREPSSLFSEGPLLVAPEKRGGQVWRETHATSPQTFLRALGNLFYLLAKNVVQYKAFFNIICFHFSKAGLFVIIFVSFWLSGTAHEETRRGGLRCGHRGLRGGR